MKSFRHRIILAIFVVISVWMSASVGFLRAQEPEYDILIRGGRIVDGTGNPWFNGDVGIKGDRIVAVGNISGSAEQVIDAEGLVVAPGFIDIHAHSELELLQDGNAESKVRQGITLDVLGEVSGLAPRDGLGDEDVGPWDRQGNGQAIDWTTFTGYFERVRQQGISISVMAYVEAAQVRKVVMGYDPGPAAAAQLERMKSLVARSMEEGARGLVTRLMSGGPAYPDEIIALAKVAASYGGNYASHIGSEGFEQEKEIDFAIRVAEEARIPVHILHFKIRARENWGTMGKFVRQIESARSRGLDITANQYPYTAMFQGWHYIFPLWSREGGPERFAERLKDPEIQRRIKRDPSFIAWAKEHGGWEGIVMARASTPNNKRYEGMRLVEIAELRGHSDPADTLLELMTEEGGSISGIFHTMSEEDVQLAMRQPWVVIATDGRAINLQKEGLPHPRNYGTTSRVLGHYVREEKVLVLEEAVRKMTSLPAQILGLRDRGLLREGFAADLVLFDPDKVRNTNSFEKPKSYPEGIPYVLVNGVLVINGGQHTGARPGRVIYGRGHKPN